MKTYHVRAEALSAKWTAVRAESAAEAAKEFVKSTEPFALPPSERHPVVVEVRWTKGKLSFCVTSGLIREYYAVAVGEKAVKR